MQTERLLALACWLEGGAHHKLRIHGREVVFDMAQGIQVLADVGADFDPNTCGTACCIAGAAVQFFAPDKAQALLNAVHEDTRSFDKRLDPSDREDDVEAQWSIDTQAKFYANSYGPGVMDFATELLGLSDSQAKGLFIPNNQFSLRHCELRDFNDPAAAARVIRHGVATGVFDWDEENWETD